MESIDKIFFTPGDLVTIKHDLPMKPIMLVKGKETKTIRGVEKDHFIGIKCFWFSTDLIYQEEIFSTKDLVRTTVKQSKDCPDCGYPNARKIPAFTPMKD